MTATVHSHPALGSTAIGITLAGGVLVMLLRDVGPLDPLAVFVGGLAVFGASTSIRRRGHRLLGSPGRLIGLCMMIAPVWLYVRAGVPEFVLLIAGLGVISVAVLSIGLLPVNGPGSRLLVKTGTGGLFAAVLVAAIGDVPDLSILIAGVGTILTWDAGEHAINVGEQLGTEAGTAPIELTHVTASAGVGAGALVLVFALGRLAPGDLSLVQFVGIIGAVVLLTLALHE